MAEMVQIILLLAFLLQVVKSGQGQLIDSGISKRARKFIVREINDFRRSVNKGEQEPQLPTPLYLKMLTYSDKISKALQEHLDKCDVDLPPFLYGDRKMGNIISVRFSRHNSSESRWEYIIESWLRKRNYYTFGKGPTGKGKNFQHIIGDRASEFGCAQSHCKTTGKNQKPFAKLYGCSFDAVARRKPYETLEDPLRTLRLKYNPIS